MRNIGRFFGWLQLNSITRLAMVYPASHGLAWEHFIY